MKYGEYARTKQGYISKLEDKDDKFLYFESTILNHYEESPVLPIEEKLLDGRYLRAKDYIIKHSNNIINLVQVGDYVNGCKVINICESQYGGEKIIYLGGFGIPKNIYVETILTKELFEQNSYKL